MNNKFNDEISNTVPDSLIKVVLDSQKEIFKQNFIENFNIKLSNYNIPDILIKNISEFNSFKELIKTNNSLNWVTDELKLFVEESDIEISEILNLTNVVIPQSNGFDYLNNTYDVEYEKTSFLLNMNSEIRQFNIPSEININNISELNGLKSLLDNHIVNPLITGSVISWMNNPGLKNFVNNKVVDFDKIVNPEINNILASQLNINENLDKIKTLLNLDFIPSLDQLTNIFNLPENFDINNLMGLLQVPNLELPSIDSLASMLSLPKLDITLPNLPNLSIPNLPSIKLPTLSSATSGLNSNRMIETMSKAQLMDFPETTPWKDVIKYQTANITKAVFDELSKMTLYIEPGEIKVLTNGSPSTHQGKNINRIKIKLK